MKKDTLQKIRKIVGVNIENWKEKRTMRKILAAKKGDEKAEKWLLQKLESQKIPERLRQLVELSLAEIFTKKEDMNKVLKIAKVSGNKNIKEIALFYFLLSEKEKTITQLLSAYDVIKRYKKSKIKEKIKQKIVEALPKEDPQLIKKVITKKVGIKKELENNHLFLRTLEKRVKKEQPGNALELIEILKKLNYKIENEKARIIDIYKKAREIGDISVPFYLIKKRWINAETKEDIAWRIVREAFEWNNGALLIYVEKKFRKSATAWLAKKAFEDLANSHFKNYNFEEERAKRYPLWKLEEIKEMQKGRSAISIRKLRKIAI